MKILVVGLKPYDSGKTTLCKALIYGFKKAGIDFIPFKPHSGINYWNQFNTFQKGLEKSTLICNDIMELEKVAGSQLPLEVLNPVNRLCKPVLDKGTSMEKLTIQEFIAERFTYHDGFMYCNIYYLSGALEINEMRGLNEFYSKITKNAGKFSFVKNFQDLTKAYTDNFGRATSSCYDSIRNKHLIIESFNNAAYPFTKAEDCDTVICTSSNIIILFETSAYFRAIRLHGGKESEPQRTVSDIARALKTQDF
jgi:predicted P-loop ATPase/GTPase